MAPIQVSLENADEVRKRLYPKKHDTKPCSFQIGDIVRLPKDKVEKQDKKKFKKRGYERSWSKELFTVVTRIKTLNGVCIYKDQRGLFSKLI